jgi:hypothetical protein
MRRLLLVILFITSLGRCVRAQNVQIALDGAADLSPVYPTSKIPANAGQVVVLFTLGDQQLHMIQTDITPITAVGKFTINREGQTAVIASGTGSRFLVRHLFIGDLPVGRWRLTVTIDQKPFGSQEFDVVPAAAPLKISSPIDLAGSLMKGTEWTNDVGAPYEPRPGLKIDLDGITKTDSQGWLRTTAIRKIVALDLEGARTDIYRSGKLGSSLWTIATDKGIAVTKESSGAEEVTMQPPELIIAWPVAEFHTSWRWHDNRQKPEFGDRFEMWGPLPIKTPNGDAPGYVVLQKIADQADSKLVAGSIETHIVPGLGAVYTAYVQSIPQYQTAMRIETRLTSMKHGSGGEPEIRKYADSLNK